MGTRSVAPMCALTLLLVGTAAATTPAQTIGGTRHRFAMLAGTGRAYERDEAVSPLRYQGWALGLDARYDAEWPRTRTAVLATFRTGGLERVNVPALGSGTQYVGSLGFSHVRLVRQLHGGTRLFAGAAVDASVAARTQRFVQSSSDYLSGVIRVAPAVRVEWDRGAARMFSWDAAAPVLSGLIRPYADAHLLMDRSERTIVWLGPGRARALTQTLGYAARMNGRLGFLAQLRAELFDYAVEPVVVGMRTQGAVGLVWWTRRAP